MRILVGKVVGLVVGRVISGVSWCFSGRPDGQAGRGPVYIGRVLVGAWSARWSGWSWASVYRSYPGRILVGQMVSRLLDTCIAVVDFPYIGRRDRRLVRRTL